MSAYRNIINAQAAASPSAQEAFPGHEGRSGANNDGGVSYDLGKARKEALRLGDLAKAKAAAAQQVRRVLIYGTADNVTNCSARKLSETALALFAELVAEDLWSVVLDDVKEVYIKGLAHKMSHCLFVLTYFTSLPQHVAGSEAKMGKIRGAAYRLIAMLRTASHLEEWATNHMALSKAGVSKSKGLGKGFRSAFEAWIKAHKGDWLAYQFTKYGKRGDISVEDLLNTTHVKGTTATKCRCRKRKGTDECKCEETPVENILSPAVQVVLAFCSKHGIDHAVDILSQCIDRSEDAMADAQIKDALKVLAYLGAVTMVKDESLSVDQTCKLIGLFNLPRETIHTGKLKDADVWTALLTYQRVDPVEYATTVKSICVTFAEKAKAALASEKEELLPLEVLEYHFPLEECDEHKEAAVDAMCINMPITALLRNLNKLSAIGLTDPSGGRPFAQTLIDSISDRVQDSAVLEKGHVHPMSMLVTWNQYGQGRGDKGSLTWTPNGTIVGALKKGFEKAFRTLQGFGVPIAHGIDASGSMAGMGTVPGINCLNASSVCALMVLAFYKAERRYSREHGTAFRQYLSYFTGRSSYYSSYHSSYYGYGRAEEKAKKEVTDITAEVSEDTTFDQMCRLVQRGDWGSTNISAFVDECSAQLRASLDKAKKGDRAFKGVPVKHWPGYYKALCIWTDNDVNSGRNVTAAMKDYHALVMECCRFCPLTGDCKKTTSDALFAELIPKMVVLATYASSFTVGDPHDPNVLGICGCDLSVPTMISNFLFGTHQEDDEDEDGDD